MVTHDVTLEWPNGPTRSVAVGEDETVLQAAERDGEALPYGCRTGACGTCVGRLLEVDDVTKTDDRTGDERPVDVDDAFAYRRAPRALKPRHRDDGYVLLCVATPTANCRIAVGSQIQSELVDNPWK